MTKKIDELFSKVVSDVTKEPRVAISMIFFGGNGIGFLIPIVLSDLIKYASDHKWLMFCWMIVVAVIMFSFFYALAIIGGTAIEHLLDGKKDEDRD